MKGTIKFDVAADSDLKEMCQWVNTHPELHLTMNFDGRYLQMDFSKDEVHNHGEISQRDDA